MLCPNGDGGGVVPLAEREHAAHPRVLLEGDLPQRANDDVRTESSHVLARPGESRDLAHRLCGDHGDAGLVEEAVLELHHLHGRPVPARDLRGQLLPDDGQLFAGRRANA